MNEKEFDLNFDFEKEYGFEPAKDEDIPKVDEDFDLRALLESDFNEEAALFHSEYESNFDYGPEEFPAEEEPAEEESPEIPEADADIEEPVSEEEASDDISEDNLLEDIPMPDPNNTADSDLERRSRERRERRAAQSQSESEDAGSEPAPNPRRRPVSKMRQFKNDTLPLLILGVTAVLILVFIIGAASRAIVKYQTDRQNEQQASESLMTKEQMEILELQHLLDDAEMLATGYDYEAAIAKLNSFSGNKSDYPEIDIRLSEYQQIQSQLIAHNDPGAVPNLSFHVLIADPGRAFSNKEYGGKYNRNFVTTDEFQKILEQLYANGFVLVEMGDIIAETQTGESITYSAKPLYLPDGKKPVMITETMVNYFNYMIDGDKDGEPDASGAGFASRLVVDDLTGKIKAEMVNSAGETVVGDYDLVPILEKFIEEHPDFSYRGARATLAITGHEGIFGYRINPGIVESRGQTYYDEQVAGAKEVLNALKTAGYEIACYTYANTAYGGKSASDIQADMASWKTEIMPIVGTLDTLVFAQTSDISTTGAYSGNKFNVLYDTGFRYFMGNGNKPAVTIGSNYVRQLRVMVTGEFMAHTATMYAGYFDAKTVLNNQRGDVPH